MENTIEMMNALIEQARKTGYINGFTAAMTVVNESLERTRNEGKDDSVRIFELLQDLLDASFKNHD